MADKLEKKLAQWLVSWSLTSPFSTNMAISETKVRGGELYLPSEGRPRRPAIY